MKRAGIVLGVLVVVGWLVVNSFHVCNIVRGNNGYGGIYQVTVCQWNWPWS